MAFLSEDIFFEVVKFTLWGMPTFNFNLSKIKYKTWSEHNLNNTRNNMKSQIQKKKKKKKIVELLIPTFFWKKASYEGTKTFLGKKIWGRCSKLEALKWSDHAKVWEEFHKW